jgi:hypothetical protein
MSPLNVETLNRSLAYDPGTGVFTRKQTETFNPRVKAGEPAGHLNRDGYVYIRIGKVSYLAHRLAWFCIHGRWPLEIDHANGVKNDNRISNLREATRSQNMANTNVPKNNTSGAKGVYFDKVNQKWMAYIMLNQRAKNLGRFDSFEEAVSVRRNAAGRIFGEFARVDGCS